KRHAGAALPQAERPPQFLWEETEAVMLGSAAQEYATGALVTRLLAADKADALGVEGLGALDIVDEQADRADLGDLERPRQHHAFDIVIGGQTVLRAMAREDGDALCFCLGHFCGLGHLRQWRLFLKAAVIEVARLAQPVPANLLDAV